MSAIRRFVLASTGAALSGLLTMSFAVPLWAQTDTTPVTIRGKGAAQLSGELVGWQNQMLGAGRPVDFAYLSRGSDEGRADLLRGAVDFAVSGVPFTEEELTRKPAGAGELISAPISVASLAVVFTTPVNARGAWSTYKEDQACLDEFFAGSETITDPEQCVTRGEFTGPFRIPPNNLTALMLGIDPATRVDLTGDPNAPQDRYAAWSSPTWQAAIGTTDLLVGGLPNNQHTWVNRTEGSAANRYLMEYGRAMAPEMWEYATTVWLEDEPDDPFDYSWEPLQNRFSTRSVTRFGSDTQMGLMAIFAADVETGAFKEGFTGNAGAIPTTLVSRYLAQYPAAGFKVMEVQNAAGDWVLPTTETIGAAVAAGDAPNIAAQQPVPNGYPLTWINRIYAFGGTLEPDQANALAASIRYVATDGQAAVVANGSAPLTDSLVAESLAAADRIVETNCPAATHEVTRGGPGVMEPATPIVQGLSGLAHCEPIRVPEATTTTTTSPSTTTTTVALSTTTTTVPGAASGAPAGDDDDDPFVPAPSGGSSATPPRSESGTATASATTTLPTSTTAPPSSVPPTSEPEQGDESSTDDAASAPTSGAPAQPEGTRLGRGLSALPFSLPDDGTGGFRKIGTFMIGALAFLGLRFGSQRVRLFA